jgi:hypothetical protein
MTISELRKRSNQFVAQLDSHIAEIVNFNEKLEELNREQLRQSKLANDQPITPGYRRGYALWKQYFYPSSYGDGKVNLFLTGRLYKSLEIRAKGKEYSISTDIPYAVELFDKYGDFLGIAPSSLEKAQSIVVPELQDKYKKLVLA